MRVFLRIVASAVLFFAPFQALAEQAFSHSNGQIATLRNDNDLWVIEAYRDAADGWQDWQWRKSFPTEQTATAYLKSQNFRAQSRPAIAPATLPRANRLVLWEAVNSWDWSWEQKYAEWVRAEIDPEFFTRYNVATDCADVAYVLRWIFAREHKLPAVARLAATGRMMTHETVRSDWERLPTAKNWFEDRRFLKAVDYLLLSTYTHTLGVDSYPVAINKDSLLAGTHYLALAGNTGHTHFVHRTYYEDPIALPIKLIASTVPRTVRSLFVTDFWEANQPERAKGGFLKFLWPVRSASGWTLKRAEEMPNFSLEQFDPAFMGEETSFAFAVYKALSPNFSIESWTLAGIRDLHEQIKMREQIVTDGAAICTAGRCEPGSENYENWSTPSRDKRLGAIFKQVDQTAERFQKTKALWREALFKDAIVLDGIGYTLNAIFYIWNFSMFESDPRAPVERRWGLSPSGFSGNLQNKITQLLSARNDKVALNKCVSCRAGDDAWNASHTFVEDHALIELRTPVERYCRRVPTHLCPTFQNLKSTIRVRVAGLDQSLNEWLDDSIWLNSDPRQSQPVRWGSMKSKFRHQLVIKDQPHVIAKNGWMFKHASGGTPTITNVRTQEIKAVPSGFTWIGLSPQGNWLAMRAIAGDSIVLQNMTTARSFTYSVDPKATGQFLGETVFVIKRSLPTSTTEFIRLGTEPASAGVLPGQKNPTASDVPGVLVELSIGTIQLVDTRSNAKRFHYLISGIPTTNYARLRFETSDSFVLETLTSIRVDKATGEPTVLPHLRGLDALALGSGHALRHNTGTRETPGAFVVSIDSILQSSSEQRYGDSVQVHAPFACFYSEGRATSHCLPYDGSRLTWTPVFADRKLLAWDQTYVAYQRSADARAYLAPINSPDRVLADALEFESAGRTAPGVFIGSAGAGGEFKFLVDGANAQLGTLLTGFIAQKTGEHMTSNDIFERGVVLELPSREQIWVELIAE